MKELSPGNIERYREEMEREAHAGRTLGEPWESRVLWAFFTIDNLRERLSLPSAEMPDAVRRVVQWIDGESDTLGVLGLDDETRDSLDRLRGLAWGWRTGALIRKSYPSAASDQGER